MRLKRLVPLPAVVCGAMMVCSTTAYAARTIQFWTPLHNPDVQSWLKTKAIPSFRSRYGVDVKVRYMTWSDYTATLLAAFAGGAGPDVFIVPAEELPFYAGRGMLTKLDSILKAWRQQADFIPAAMQSCLYKGDTVAVPYTVFARAMVYRKDVFERAGLPASHGPNTWSDVKDYSVKTTQYSGNAVTCYGLDWTWAQEFCNMAWSYGARVVSDDGRSTDLNSTPVQKALQLRLEVQNNQFPAGKAASSGGEAALAKGRMAMAWLEPTSFGNILKLSPKDERLYGVGEPPKEQTRVSAVHTARLGMSAGSRRRTEAWQWMAFLEEPENLTTFGSLFSRFTARKSLRNTGYVAGSEVLPLFYDTMTDYGRPWLALSCQWSNLAAALEAQLTAVKAGRKSPKQALEDAASAWAKELSKARAGMTK